MLLSNNHILTSNESTERPRFSAHQFPTIGPLRRRCVRQGVKGVGISPQSQRPRYSTTGAEDRVLRWFKSAAAHALSGANVHLGHSCAGSQRLFVQGRAPNGRARRPRGDHGGRIWSPGQDRGRCRAGLNDIFPPGSRLLDFFCVSTNGAIRAMCNTQGREKGIWAGFIAFYFVLFERASRLDRTGLAVCLLLFARYPLFLFQTFVRLWGEGTDQ
jgi:hypothetical protein